MRSSSPEQVPKGQRRETLSLSPLPLDGTICISRAWEVKLELFVASGNQSKIREGSNLVIGWLVTETFSQQSLNISPASSRTDDHMQIRPDR